MPHFSLQSAQPKAPTFDGCRCSMPLLFGDVVTASCWVHWHRLGLLKYRWPEQVAQQRRSARLCLLGVLEEEWLDQQLVDSLSPGLRQN